MSPWIFGDVKGSLKQAKPLRLLLVLLPEATFHHGGTLTSGRSKKYRRPKWQWNTWAQFYPSSNREPLSSPDLSIQKTMLEISSMCSQGVADIIHVCKNSYCHIWIELPASNEKRLNILWYPRQPHSKELSGLAVPSLRNPHRMCSLPWVHNTSLTYNIYVFYQSKFCYLLFILTEPDETSL